MVGPVLTGWTRFWPKMTVLTRNDLKLIFYPGQHGLTRIDRVHSVLTKNDGFDPKWPETHFLSQSTWFDPYWPGLGFGRKWRFWPETAWNSFFTLVDMVWPVLIRWTRFWSKMTVFTWNGMKLIFYPSRDGLTRIDPVDSVLMERCGWLEKNIFLNFKLFFNFFWFFMNNNRNKITFRKILVNPKLGYSSCPLFTMLTVQRDWKIHFLLTLRSKFCKEKRWRCWKIHRFFSWSNSYGRPAQVKNMKVFSILIFFCELLVCEIHERDFNLGLVKYLKVISTLILWNTWKWFQQWCCKLTRLWNTWKWFQHWFLWNT